MGFAFWARAWFAGGRKPAVKASAFVGFVLRQLANRELLPLEFFLSEQEDLGIAHPVAHEFLDYFFQEVDQFPSPGWLPSFLVALLAVVKSTQILKLKKLFFYSEGFSQSHRSHNPFRWRLLVRNT